MILKDILVLMNGDKVKLQKNFVFQSMSLEPSPLLLGLL